MFSMTQYMKLQIRGLGIIDNVVGMKRIWLEGGGGTLRFAGEN